MAKYSKDLSEDLKQLVEEAVSKTNLESIGVRVEPIRLNKSKGVFGEVIKGNDLLKLFTNGDDVVAIALFEDVFDRLEISMQKLLIESLVSQISYDLEKDKLVITKPELNIPRGMYQNYGAEIVNAHEIALLEIMSINEEKSNNK